MKKISLFIGASIISTVVCAHSITSDSCYQRVCPEVIDTGNYIVDHDVYIADVDCSTKLSSWVAYKVDSKNINGPIRHRVWRIDETIPAECTTKPSDYDGAYKLYTYEKGHMAPLGSFSNNENWSNTNILTNIEPQTKNLNEGPWAALEMHVRSMSLLLGKTYVISGPIYEEGMDHLPENEYVRVPSAFFKVIINNSIIESFIIPQKVERYEDYNMYRATIEEIEERSGVDLNLDLPPIM